MMKPGAPAFVRLFDLPAKRLGHDLMAKADADELAGPGGADELFERRDPRQGIINSSG